MPTHRPPNIVLCLCDQLRAFELGCYGNPVIRTPHLDRLAAESARFTTAVSNYPVCMAARSMVLSGQHARRCTGGVGNVSTHGTMPEYPAPGREHLPDPTLPETLRDAGYHTAAIGKWHIHVWPDELGFSHYLIPRVHHCHTGQSYTEDGGPEFVPPGYSVDFEAERVGQFLDDRRRCDDQDGQPFFLYYNISPPHCPVADGPDHYLNMYRPAEVPLRPNVDLTQPIPDLEHWMKVYRWDFRYYKLGLPYTDTLPEAYDIRHAIAEYYGMTTWVDDTVGRLLAHLERTGLAENTIVIFSSDHGDNLGSHGRVQKNSLNEESIRVPLMVRWPGRIAPSVVNGQIASLIDLAPTLLDLAGVDLPPTVHGQSLAPVLRGQRNELPHNEAVIQTARALGIRTPTHHYGLPWTDKTRRTLADAPDGFFDLAADPYQLDNLARSEQQRDVAMQLDARLRRWHETTPWLED